MASFPKTKFLDRTTPPHVLTLVLLAGLSALSMNIFLPSLPNMAKFFDAEYGLIQLSISLYLFVTGLLQLIIGPMSDRFGRRPVILVGITIFMLATIGCLLTDNVMVFLTFRMIQAAIAIGMVLSRAIVRDMVPMDQAASMIGYVTMGMSLVPMAAPAVGGYLDELIGWQANFSILLVLGAIIGTVVWFDLGETNAHKTSSLAAQMADYPELFRSRRFWGYALTAAFSSGSFFAFLGGAPFVAQSHYGLPPSEMGLYFALVSIGYLIGNFLTGRYSVRIGVNHMMLYGAIFTLTGMVTCLLTILVGFDHPLVFFGFMGTVGIGNGLVLPNANAGMLSVRPHLAGSASGLGGSIMLLGGATLAAFTGMILTPGSGPYPLLYVMIATGIAAILTINYIMSVARKAGPLAGKLSD